MFVIVHSLQTTGEWRGTGGLPRTSSVGWQHWEMRDVDSSTEGDRSRAVNAQLPGLRRAGLSMWLWGREDTPRRDRYAYVL